MPITIEDYDKHVRANLSNPLTHPKLCETVANLHDAYIRIFEEWIIPKLPYFAWMMLQKTNDFHIRHPETLWKDKELNTLMPWSFDYWRYL